LSQTDSANITQQKKQMAGIFDRAAMTYDQVGPHFFSHFGRRLVEIARIPAGLNVLDVATGRGAVLYPAAEAVGAQGHVTGIDLSEMMVRETAQELTLLKIAPNVAVRQMDAEHLQFPDKSFDYVLCGFAIFFFPQLELAMSEFRRVLKPQGQICVTTWNKIWDEQWSWVDEMIKAYLPPEPETNPAAAANSAPQAVFNTPEGLTAIMNAAGFGDIQIFSEATDFVYATEEEMWATWWSHGVRAPLEQIEQTSGPDGLQKFKAEIFKKAGAMKQNDGIHQTFAVLTALANKP
jgi:ubiquinone/menaquinone biosynthesis C-methylase UbiE